MKRSPATREINHVISMLFVFNLFNNPSISILCSNCKQNVQILHILLILHVLLRLVGENAIPFDDLFCMFEFSHTPYIKFTKCYVNVMLINLVKK